MKRFRKIAALVLVAVMMLTLSLSTSAGLFDNTYVDGYYNTEGQYYIRIGKFNIISMANIAAELAEKSGGEWSIIARMRFGDDALLSVSFDGATGNTFSLMSNQDSSSFDFGDDAPLGARYYNNGGDDNGFVVFFDSSSKYLPMLAESNEVLLQYVMLINGEEQTVVFDNGEDWSYTVTNFNGLKVEEAPAEKPEAPADEPEAPADEPEAPADEPNSDKTSPDTGVEGAAVAFGAVVAAGAAVILSRKRK